MVISVQSTETSGGACHSFFDDAAAYVEHDVYLCVDGFCFILLFHLIFQGEKRCCIFFCCGSPIIMGLTYVGRLYTHLLCIHWHT